MPDLRWLTPVLHTSSWTSPPSSSNKDKAAEAQEVLGEFRQEPPRDPDVAPRLLSLCATFDACKVYGAEMAGTLNGQFPGDDVLFGYWVRAQVAGLEIRSTLALWLDAPVPGASSRDSMTSLRQPGPG